MKLNELLDAIDQFSVIGENNPEITSIAYDSRKVMPGSLFVCIRGEVTDGHKYIKNALAAGAAAVVVEEDAVYCKVKEVGESRGDFCHSVDVAADVVCKKNSSDTVAETNLMCKSAFPGEVTLSNLLQTKISRDMNKAADLAQENACYSAVAVKRGILSQCKETTIILVKNSRTALAQLSAAWFRYPARRMTMIGLTGTKGKTTTAHMIKKILEKAGHKVGMIGTMGAFIGEEKIPVKNTTPESYELHSLFSDMWEKGCQYVVMEVSSQGLKHRRTEGILFDYGAFLNISPDHIGVGEQEYFEEYLACKKLLFSQTKCAVANIDDRHWKEVTGKATELITVSTRTEADFMGDCIENRWEPGVLGVDFRITGRLQENVLLSMPGRFNVENALAAAAITTAIGVNGAHIKAGLKEVMVKGRTQVLQEVAHFSTFLIDYAHNALSMESLLRTLKAYRPERLVCLFGGGGNKAVQRRYDMGYIAGKYADLTIITMDNPRYEEISRINADIIRGLCAGHGRYQIIIDREKAIQYLIDHCGRGDIVALIGKGHEDYQEVRGVKYHFSEEETVIAYLNTK